MQRQFDEELERLGFQLTQARTEQQHWRGWPSTIGKLHECRAEIEALISVAEKEMHRSTRERYERYAAGV